MDCPSPLVSSDNLKQANASSRKGNSRKSICHGSCNARRDVDIALSTEVLPRSLSRQKPWVSRAPIALRVSQIRSGIRRHGQAPRTAEGKFTEQAAACEGFTAVKKRQTFPKVTLVKTKRCGELGNGFSEPPSFSAVWLSWSMRAMPYFDCRSLPPKHSSKTPRRGEPDSRLPHELGITYCPRTSHHGRPEKRFTSNLVSLSG